MDKEDQIIERLKAIEGESKLIRGLLTTLLALVSLYMLLNAFGD